MIHSNSTTTIIIKRKVSILDPYHQLIQEILNEDDYKATWIWTIRTEPNDPFIARLLACGAEVKVGRLRKNTTSS